MASCWQPGDYTPRPSKRRIRADAVLTNQGGVPLRWCGFEWARKYPTLRQVLARVRVGMQVSGARRALVACYHPKQEQCLLGRMLACFGRVVPRLPIPVSSGIIYLSFSPRARKPSPWGLLWLARGRAKDSVIFLGDEPSDREAADRAGIRFRLVASERSKDKGGRNG